MVAVQAVVAHRSDRRPRFHLVLDGELDAGRGSAAAGGCRGRGRHRCRDGGAVLVLLQDGFRRVLYVFLVLLLLDVLAGRNGPDGGRKKMLSIFNT